MLAVFQYGEFTMEKQVDEARRYYVLVTPLEPLNLLRDPDPLQEVELMKMHFELAAPPRLGEPLKYVYAGRS